MGITNITSHEIRRFVLQWEKTNTKKFHLINWSLMLALKNPRGLGIKDSHFMNIAMGARILWRLINDKLEW